MRVRLASSGGQNCAELDQYRKRSFAGRRPKWAKLTDDDLTAINGKRDQLEGKIQERYGLAKDQVKNDVDSWYSSQSW